jgi:hypothetical protein
MSPPTLPVAVDNQPPLTGRGATLVREEAQKAKTQAREAVVLLEQARTMLYEDNARQLAIKHIEEAITEADRRAAMLEEWYWRIYSSADSSPLKQVYKPTAQGY